jgi:hypothetical protein
MCVGIGAWVCACVCVAIFIQQAKHMRHIGCGLSASTTFLGTFAKLRKATISFVMSIRLSACLYVCMEQLGSHWTILMEFYI